MSAAAPVSEKVNFFIGDLFDGFLVSSNNRFAGATGFFQRKCRLAAE
jgi:hypothetical protein